MHRVGLLLWPAGIALGLIAEQVAFGWGNPGRWVPDLAVGWSFIGCGLIAAARRPESRSGAIMTATGFTWFAGNFSHAGLGAVDWSASHALYLYRGPLIHLILTYPSGRPSSRLTRTEIAAAYMTAIVTPAWRSEAGSIVLSALLFGIIAREYRHAVGASRRARLLALRAALGLGLAFAGTATARLALPAGIASGPSLLVTEAMLCAVAIGLFAGLLSPTWERAAVTDLVVELGEDRSGTFREGLARALGDPSLEIGYWVADSSSFVDREGRVMSLPDAGTDRSVTVVQRDEQPVAVLIHDPAVLADPGLLDAVSSAARLAASNARLQAEVRARVGDLMASRRRILEAGDDERRRLERRLHDGAEHRLENLAEALRLASAEGRSLSAATRETLERARNQVDSTLEDLRELARGLHPRAVAELGLGRALELLAERSRVPIELSVEAEGLPPDVEAAAYFLCSEGLVNIEKHASATRAGVSVALGGDVLSVTITDDGVGGADLSLARGLRGLADRMEALGGTLIVESKPGEGTRLFAAIPLR
jgi:signal transduction histidine kinase